jgi:signal peptidase I
MNNAFRSRDVLKNVGYNLLSEGKSIRIQAHGYSMYPCIRPGSVLLIEPIGIKGKPVPGEIIAIKRESGLVVHRLVKSFNKGGTEYFVARGDSNGLPDDPVKMNMIAGRIVRAEFSAGGGLADVRINTSPSYIWNRIKVIWIILMKKISRVWR